MEAIMSRVKINNKWVKITGAKQAIGEYNNWINRNWRYTANIMFDKSNGKIWTDTFIDKNTWNCYHDNDVISLSHYIRERTGGKLTMQLLKEYAIELLREE
jgi:hypothetical protein